MLIVNTYPMMREAEQGFHLLLSGFFYFFIFYSYLRPMSSEYFCNLILSGKIA